MRRTTAPDGRVYVSGPGLVTTLVDAADVDFMFSTTGAARAGYGKNLRLPASVVEPSARAARGGHGLFSPGRPVTAPFDPVTPAPRAHADSTPAAPVWGAAGRVSHT